MGEPKLLPCPFGCKGGVFVRHKGAGAPLIFVWCSRCETHGPPHYVEADAIAAWNTRPTPEHSTSLVEAHGPFPDRSPFGEVGKIGSPKAYLIDPGAGSASDYVSRFWPDRFNLDSIYQRGGSITPLYDALRASSGTVLMDREGASDER